MSYSEHKDFSYQNVATFLWKTIEIVEFLKCVPNLGLFGKSWVLSEKLEVLKIGKDGNFAVKWESRGF